MKFLPLFLGLFFGAATAGAASDNSVHEVFQQGTLPMRAHGPWLVQLKSRTDLGAQSTFLSRPQLASLYRAGLAYRFARSKSLGLFQEVEYDTSQKNHPDFYAPKDLYLDYSDRAFGHLPYDWDLFLNFRLFLPTSEKARLTRENGAELLSLEAERAAGKFTLNAQAIAYFHNQTQNFFLKEKRKKVANAAFETDQLFQLTYDLLPRLALWHSTGLEYTWKYKTAGAGAYLHANWANETGFTYEVMKNASISPSLVNEPEFDSRTNIALYRSEDTVYRLTLGLKI